MLQNKFLDDITDFKIKILVNCNLYNYKLVYKCIDNIFILYNLHKM